MKENMKERKGKRRCTVWKNRIKDMVGRRTDKKRCCEGEQKQRAAVKENRNK